MEIRLFQPIINPSNIKSNTLTWEYDDILKYAQHMTGYRRRPPTGLTNQILFSGLKILKSNCYVTKRYQRLQRVGLAGNLQIRILLPTGTGISN